MVRWRVFATGSVIEAHLDGGCEYAGVGALDEDAQGEKNKGGGGVLPRTHAEVFQRRACRANGVSSAGEQ